MMNVVALSMRQPWCYAVTDLGKQIENRPWNTKHRGRFLIHASKRRYRQNEERYYAAAVQQMLDMGCIKFAHQIPPLDVLPFGGFVASASLVDVVHRLDTPDRWAQKRWRERYDFRWWMEDRYGFILERVEKLQLGVQYPGALQFFKVPDDIVRQTGAFVL